MSDVCYGAIYNAIFHRDSMLNIPHIWKFSREFLLTIFVCTKT